MNYVRSKQRVADHGEVFTPAWMVDAMLDLVKDETERIDSRFLEPVVRKNSLKHVRPPDSTRDGAHPALVGHSRRDAHPSRSGVS